MTSVSIQSDSIQALQEHACGIGNFLLKHNHDSKRTSNRKAYNNNNNYYYYILLVDETEIQQRTNRQHDEQHKAI